MPALVTSEQDVVKNIATLRRYQEGDEKEREFHDGLIRKGRLFVVGSYESQYAFAPSRFAGYRLNTLIKHNRSESKDGKVTNPALNRIFGRPIDEKNDNAALYQKLDAAFHDYCSKSNIVPDNIPNPRKYWLTSGVIDFSGGESGGNASSGDAIDDIGADCPGMQTYTGKRYSRDLAVRAAVMNRAGGVCEHCNKPGFLGADGQPYLECHHIIALAKDGADRMTNVIALCPNDHREAHFGKRRFKLERAMIRKIKQINDGQA